MKFKTSTGSICRDSAILRYWRSKVQIWAFTSCNRNWNPSFVITMALGVPPVINPECLSRCNTPLLGNSFSSVPTMKCRIVSHLLEAYVSRKEMSTLLESSVSQGAPNETPISTPVSTFFRFSLNFGFNTATSPLSFRMCRDLIDLIPSTCSALFCGLTQVSKSNSLTGFSLKIIVMM
ncbi:hypothetical protein WICPIJ_008179 [Wickerhamomyces pijperi]|uniref:Uncharacterized protein n=1 Tax=Wickerhamomyces pijperi TaxID=599730 RepID=A0A9P8PZZ0_WICPI|nr:hypothetical protein WICPIJ_008179 [Wickerhamomyces pijperi]